MGHLETGPTDHFEGISASQSKGQTRAVTARTHHRSQSMKDLTLNQREQARLHVLNTVLEHQLPVSQAAEVMGVTERHAWRMLAAYRKEGAAALAHGNRGHRPRNAVSDAEATAVVELASTTYAGANQTHFAELLRDREGIDLSRRTVHRILIRAGIPSPRKRRPPRHRVRRQRMPQEGMLVQIDGSHHPWLGKGGPHFTLLLAVDDATGTVANALFRQEEDTRGYFDLIEGLVQRRGVPIALYGDRHGVFKFSGKPRHIQPPVEATHFSRAMVELGIQQIFARSPQAKGRVERMAGTFQDRLVTELRLAGAGTIDQANTLLRDFLPRFNGQFGVPAELPEPAYRTWDPQRVLAEVLCFKHTRKVARDNTVKYQWRTLQLFPSAERPSYAGLHVEVLEHTDGRLQIRYQDEIIPCRQAPPRPGVLRASHGALAPTPELNRIVKLLGNHRLSQPQLRQLANLEPTSVDDQVANDDPVHSVGSSAETVLPPRRELTPRQLALWKAVQHARVQGLDLREIARQLGISRNTVRKYARALTQPTNRPHNHGPRPSSQIIT